MFRNYIKIAWRNLVRNRAFTLINMLGLSVGMAVCLIITLFVVREITFDTFHEDAERIHRVLAEEIESGDVRHGLPEDIGMKLAADFPQVEAFAVYNNAGELLVSAGDRQFYEKEILYVNPGFLDLFSFELLYGNSGTALDDPGSVVITEDFARKYFGDGNAVGKVITTRDEEVMKMEDRSIIRDNRGTVNYTVAAVLESLPGNSSVTFNMLIPFEPDGSAPYWWNYGNYNYVKLRSGNDPAGMETLLKEFMVRHAGSAADNFELRLQPLPEAHLYPQMNTATRTGPLQYVYIFSLAAVLILLIAVMNYMNLSTARSSQRAREVGVRKVMGGNRSELMRQFLFESILLSTLSMLVALLVAGFSLPWFNSILGTELSMQPVWGPAGLLCILAVTVLTGLLSGSYSAFVLSRFSPVRVMKGAFMEGAGNSRFRKVLVVAQFAGSIVLILASVTIFQQMEFIREARLNVGGEEVVIVENKNDSIDQRYESFRQDLLASPSVAGVTTGQMPGRIRYRTSWAPKDTTSGFEHLDLMWVGRDYLTTLGLKMVAGHRFEEAPVSDPAAAGAKIINETAARAHGLEDKVGQQVSLNGEGLLTGIVEDYHAQDLYTPISPLVIEYREGAQETILVRLESGAVSAGLEEIHAAWDRYVTERPLYYRFLDEQLDGQYRAELRLSKIFWVFTVIAIVIACLGLLGLSAYTAERRTKEIGIRKVLGATVVNVIGLLSRDFIKLVLAGFLIAAPVAWYFMSRWLTDFPYRIELGPGIFLLSGCAAVFIAFVTVSWQSVRAAVANPVESLRSE